ncbi:unnamed protein product [Ilex paraguariensis]|uniref:Uncharacterized protein n=1 Tax=Ilex paraguariensis TaxID=185542 RepID=A0ABC8T9E5_9AQUA
MLNWQSMQAANDHYSILTLAIMNMYASIPVVVEKRLIDQIAKEGDIKLENILPITFEKMKLADFDLAMRIGNVACGVCNGCRDAICWELTHITLSW